MEAILVGASWDEENWRAQYGQVVPPEEEPLPGFPVVELWDWAVVTGSRKEGKGKVSRLVGRLVKKSAKLHPSVPSGGGFLKTAPVCEVHLDLVRVTSGLHLPLLCNNIYFAFAIYSRSFFFGLFFFSW